MSKIRSVRQRADAPRQDEGPGTRAALLAGAALGLAADAVALALPRQQARLLSGAGICLVFAVADGRRTALLVQTGELLGVHRAGRPGRPARLAGPARCRLAGARYLGSPAPPGAAGPPRCGPGTRRFASATTWPALCRCSPASSSWGPAGPALRRPAPGCQPGRPGRDISPEDGPQNRPGQHRTERTGKSLPMVG
jgi:hypothetical protein